MIKELEKIEDIIKITLSNPFKKDGVAKKIVLTKIENKNQLFFYVEKFVENQSFHKNLGTDELLVYFEEI